jgi:hypothetical protein
MRSDETQTILDVLHREPRRGGGEPFASSSTTQYGTASCWRSQLSLRSYSAWCGVGTTVNTTSPHLKTRHRLIAMIPGARLHHDESAEPRKSGQQCVLCRYRHNTHNAEPRVLPYGPGASAEPSRRPCGGSASREEVVADKSLLVCRGAAKHQRSVARKKRAPAATVALCLECANEWRTGWRLSETFSFPIVLNRSTASGGGRWTSGKSSMAT